MGMESSPESPQPVRVVLQAVGGWIGRLGRIWIEGQVAELHRRGGMAYITLRDPVANVSARVTCSIGLLRAADRPPDQGAGGGGYAKPASSGPGGRFPFQAWECRLVAVATRTA